MSFLSVKESIQSIFIDLRADNAKAARCCDTALSYIALAGSVVKVIPAAVACNDTLSSENHTVFLLVFKSEKS